MIELEYRLFLKCSNYGALLKTFIKRFKISDVKTYTIYYIKPYFRFKHNTLEVKQTISNTTLYHDGLWFKFCASEEIPFEKWSKHMSLKFLENAGQFSNPFSIEYRTELSFPEANHLKVYGFQKNNLSGVMFEFELDPYPNKDDTTTIAIETIQSIIHETKDRLYQYKDIYQYFREEEEFFSSSSSTTTTTFPYIGLKDCSRKPVLPIDSKNLLDQLSSSSSSSSLTDCNNFLVAQKHDGIFGFVYSFANEIREVWEDNQFRLFRGKSLGDGFVFGAEKMSDKVVILLDVYQVRGSPVVCTKNLLLEFLPRLAHRYPRYRVQTYFLSTDIATCPFSSYCDSLLSSSSSTKGKGVPEEKKSSHNKSSSRNNNNNVVVDGLIFHDTKNDKIYKLKSKQTLDLVHFDGYFIFPNNEKKKISREYLPLKNGVVYECAVRPFLKPLRERVDRFVGNSKKQMANILECQ